MYLIPDRTDVRDREKKRARERMRRALAVSNDTAIAQRQQQLMLLSLHSKVAQTDFPLANNRATTRVYQHPAFTSLA